jgi:hypothetical protein
MSGVFISHNHQDKTFVHSPGADLAANGVRPWIDDAELNIWTRLSLRSGRRSTRWSNFGIVLSPRSVASAWVEQELEQALATQLASRQIISASPGDRQPVRPRVGPRKGCRCKGALATHRE